MTDAAEQRQRPSLLQRLQNLAGAATPQVAGLAAQIIIIKLAVLPHVVDRLPLYNFALSFSAILFLGIAYRQSRFEPATSHIAMLQIPLLCLYLLGWSGYFANGTVAIIAITLSCVTSAAILHLQMLGRFERNVYLASATLLSLTLPNILWLDEHLAIGFAILLALATTALALDPTPAAGDADPAAPAFSRESFYSVFLQIPLLSLTLFDPWIAVIIGPERYVDYAIFLKVTNGVFLFAFANIQLRLLMRDVEGANIANYERFTLLLMGASFALASFDGVPFILVQCLFLSIAVNLLSVIVRFHLQFRQPSRYPVLTTTAALLCYAGATYYLFAADIRIVNYTPVTIAFMVAAALPLMRPALLPHRQRD